MGCNNKKGKGKDNYPYCNRRKTPEASTGLTEERKAMLRHRVSTPYEQNVRSYSDEGNQDAAGPRQHTVCSLLPRVVREDNAARGCFRNTSLCQNGGAYYPG